ncbi:hypothetical protein AB0M43_24490 [Longispora sp. NPDC051575]|uniref:hypothetical protein n=1 Tax=Longispora sp. NPDC051575 TaxID=3154943 RepID=UPI003427EEAE
MHATNGTDQSFFQWMLSHAAYAVTHGVNPMHDSMMNVPDGVNLMANTSVLALAIPLIPVTLLFGPAVSYLVMLTLAFVLTSCSWYWLLSRHVVTSRLAAFLGAALCGFGPGMMSQGNGHPNLVAQFLIPVILWAALRLRHTGPLRGGAVLGLLVVWQAFINEEVLFLSAIGLGLYVLAYAALDRDAARAAWKPMAAGLGVAFVVAGALLAYPLWYQFFGWQSYRSLPLGVEHYGADLASFASFSRLSLLGDPVVANRLAPNASEENTFFGWPLLVAVVVAVAWMWREHRVKALALVGVVLSLCALGPRVMSYAQDTGIPGPWRLLARLPLFDTVVPVRIGLFVLPVVGILTALAVQRLLDVTAERPNVRRVAFIGVAVVLVPLLPVPLPATHAPVPKFIASGAYEPYVTGGRSMVTLPPPHAGDATVMRWSASRNLDFPVAAGYFLGPGGDFGTSLFGPPKRASDHLFTKVMQTRAPYPVTDADRSRARDDLRFWKAGAIVMVPKADPVQEDAMLRTATDLYGSPTWTGELWLWDARTVLDGK